MRVVTVCQDWDVDGPFPVPGEAVAKLAVSTWRKASPDVDMVTFAVGDGGPRSAGAVAGSRVQVGGVDVVIIDTGVDDVAEAGTVMLAPRANASRWSPLDLSSALIGLAASASAERRRLTVVVPVGNADCAGDATDLWGVGDHALAAASMRATVSVLDIVVLTTTDRPLLGFHGMNSALRDGRESDAVLSVAAQTQEERWTGIARAVDPGAARPMLVGSSRLSDQPGTGAAAGLAYCLAALGAHLVTDAAGYLADTSGATAALNSELSVAVVLSPVLTPSSLDHGMARSLARAASEFAIPVVAIAPGVHVGKRDLMAAGLAAAYEAGHGTRALEDQIRRVAQTWTPRRSTHHHD